MAATPRKPPPEPGKEHDAYCTKCKIVLAHVIVAVTGRRIAKVQCLTCDGVHAYRANPPGTRARGGRKSSTPSPAEVFDQMMKGRDVSDAKSYKIGTKFDEGDVLDHTKFGMGVVTKVLADAKVEVIFAGGTKVLVHERTSL